LTSHEAFEGIQKFFFEEAKVEVDLAADLSDAAILHKMRSEGKELLIWKARHKILENWSKVWADDKLQSALKQASAQMIGFSSTSRAKWQNVISQVCVTC